MAAAGRRLRGAVAGYRTDRPPLHRHRNGDTADQYLNARFVGDTFILAEPIVEGRGRLRINDGVWQAGPTLLLARVKVTGAEGTVLTVTSA